MVVGFGAGVVPSTTSNARGALLWVFGARGDIGAVTPVGHLNPFPPKLLYTIVAATVHDGRLRALGPTCSHGLRRL